MDAKLPLLGLNISLDLHKTSDNLRYTHTDASYLGSISEDICINQTNASCLMKGGPNLSFGLKLIEKY